MTDATGEPSRYCTRCTEHKSIRGVWYLVQPVQGGDTEFHCETCFSVGRSGMTERARPQPVVDPARMPVGPGTARGELMGRRGF